MRASSLGLVVLCKFKFGKILNRGKNLFFVGPWSLFFVLFAQVGRAAPLIESTVLPKSFRQSLIPAHFEKTSQVRLHDSRWNKLSVAKFKIFAQKTVQLNDKIANAALKQTDLAGKVKEVSLRVLYTDSKVFLNLDWEDSSQSLFSRKETNSFGDSVALEIPKEFSERLPYIGMGDEKKNVYVYMQRAAEEGTLLNEYVASGFGSLTRINKNISKVEMNYDQKTKRWQALFSLPLDSRNLKQAILPIAFAFWDGDKNERGGNKYLSAWQFIEMPSLPKNPSYLKQISFAYDDLPSTEKGKQIFNTVCVACHLAGSNGNAQGGLAPNLENIGSLSSTSYLRDSLVEPSQIVVRQLNINRHYDKTVTPDANRAYTNNDSFKWYSINEKGERVSKMPSFKSMSDDDIRSLVAFLKTLQ
jgi:complex iron-sulfur molybdoenzyme family reductase subunit gamma